MGRHNNWIHELPFNEAFEDTGSAKVGTLSCDQHGNEYELCEWGNEGGDDAVTEVGNPAYISTSDPNTMTFDASGGVVGRVSGANMAVPTATLKYFWVFKRGHTKNAFGGPLVLQFSAGSAGQQIVATLDNQFTGQAPAAAQSHQSLGRLLEAVASNEADNCWLDCPGN